MELNELIERAQTALDGGDYGLAIAACAHALETFPTCLSAHRVMGEAHLEQGDIEHAVAHFERTLALDPLNVVACLGLGVAAEERNDPHAAYTAYLRAWDLNPTLDQLRDELVRLRSALGSDARLHPSRAGLATIYARGGQFGRAAAEWRAVLTAEPDSDRAHVALAEVLWRQRDDAGAAAACREALRLAPENARALAILADVEARRGEPSAAATAERYRGVDPAADVVAALVEGRAPADLTFLRQAPVVADFDFDAFAPPPAPEPDTAIPNPVAALAGSHMAAPDLWDTLIRDLEPGATDGAAPMDGVPVPFDWADDGPGSFDPRDDVDEPAAAEADPLADFSPPAPPDAPIEWPTSDAAEVPPARADDLADLAIDGGLAAATNGASDVYPLDPLATVESAPADAARPSAAPWMNATPEAPDPFLTADGRIDLTVGWDQLDRILDQATPAAATAAGYDDLLAELDAGGIAPFAAVEPASDEAAWEPFTAADLGAADATPAAPSPALPHDDAFLVGLVDAAPELLVAPTIDAIAEHEPALLSPPPDEPIDALAATSQAWDSIDQDLLAAIPEEAASGYTDMLRNIDAEETVQPFVPEDADEIVDPLANPDAVGAPLEFDDLLTVTSRDGTSALNPAAAMPNEPTPAFEALAPADVPWDVSGAASPAGGEPALDALLGEIDGVEPFSFAVDAARAVDGGADFSDIDDVPFDPAAYAVPFPFDAALGLGARNGVDAFGTGEELDLDLDLVVDLGMDLGLAVEPSPAEVGDGWIAGVAATTIGADDRADSFLDVEAKAESDTAWPAFIGGTSELIDRDQGLGGLFAPLREEKATLLALGQVTTDRRISAAVPATAPVATPGPVRATPVPATTGANGANGGRGGILSRSVTVLDGPSDLGLDVAALRAELRANPAGAADVAATIEAAIETGPPSALVRRALGEAYLKLGRSDAAAAQFRLAMAQRTRG